MGNSLRCCLACVLPCGALDVVRVVHLNGQVELYSRPVSAREVLAAHPNHVISKPCSQGVVRKILMLSPDSELKRGHIYFLLPESALPGKERKKIHRKRPQKTGGEVVVVKDLDHDNSVEQEVVSSKVCHRRRRSGRVGVWRPHLETISED